VVDLVFQHKYWYRLRGQVGEIAMKTYAAIFCVMFFACGTLLVPALHQAGLCFPHGDCTAAAESHRHQDRDGNTSDSGKEGHNSDNCAICKLAATPTTASCSAIQIAPPSLTAEPLLLANTRTTFRLDSGTFHARAPPILSSI